MACGGLESVIRSVIFRLRARSEVEIGIRHQDSTLSCDTPGAPYVQSVLSESSLLPFAVRRGSLEAEFKALQGSKTLDVGSPTVRKGQTE